MSYLNSTESLSHKIFYFSILVLPVSLVSGPFIPDFIVSICCILFLINIKNFEYLKNKYFIFFLLFYFYLVFCSFLAENPALSFKNSVFYFRHGIFAIIVWKIIWFNNSILNKLFYVLAILALVIFFDTIYQLYFGHNLLGFEPVMKKRLSSFFGDELILGGYFLRIFPILAALFFYLNFGKKNSLKNIILTIIFISIFEIVIFLSGERTAFYLFNFLIFLMFFLLKLDFRFKASTLLILIALLFSLLFKESIFQKRIINETFTKKNFEKDGKIVFFTEQHTEHYFSAIKMFKDNILIGVGPKNFREVCKKKEYNFSEKTCSTHPHNTYVQLLSETGIVGFLFIFFIFLNISYYLIKTLYFKFIKKKFIFTNFQICLLLGIFINLWPISPTGNFFNNWLSIIYFFSVGITIFAFNNKNVS